MSEALITTKLNIPQFRPNLISRPRLLNRLEANLWQAGGFTRKLTLVSAPAGYGKTTLIAEWAVKVKGKVDTQSTVQDASWCWLSLEEGDNDQVRFLTYFIAALKRAEETIGDTALGILQAPQGPPPEVYLTTLINDIARVSHAINLVLDDYHLIQTPAIHQMLNFIIEHQPSNMHLVLLTRDDPSLPIPRLRARGQILEIRQEGLRFTFEEMRDYLRRLVGISLPAEDLRALERRTEGWVAGLQLAALSMQGREDLSDFIRDFTGSNRYILDYLIEEVFQSQPPGVQDFLLKISVLDRLTAPLCDAVGECSNSREILQSFEHANLFIVALDQEHAWYRFHRLFVELLRHRLRVSTNLSETLLHEKASLWYEANGYQVEAIQHALYAENWERAAVLIRNFSEELLKRGEVMTLIGWIKQLPDEIIQAYPELCGDYAWALLLKGDLDSAEPLLSHAESYLQDDPQFQGGIASAQAYLARSRGDFQGTIEKSEKALSLLPEKDLATRSIVAMNLGLTYWHAGMLGEAKPVLEEAVRAGEGSGNVYAAVAARVFLGRTEASLGHLGLAENIYKQVITNGGPVPMLALTYLDLSALYYEWNKLDISTDHLHQGMDLCKRSGNLEFQIAGELLQVRLKLAIGALEAAEQAAQRAHQLAQDFSPFTRARCASSLVQVALAKNDLETAIQWADQIEVDGDHFTFYMFLNLTRARTLMAQGKQEEAAAELSECYEKACKGRWGYGVITTRVLQCLAAETTASAHVYLLDALSLAQPEGFLRTFLDFGERIIPFLQEAALRGEWVEYVSEILAAIGSKPKSLVSASLVEPISERESEVLRLLVVGLSNREIAAKLVLSLGTVKTHIHNIYGKLDVRNRAEAIARARELELL